MQIMQVFKTYRIHKVEGVVGVGRVLTIFTDIVIPDIWGTLWPLRGSPPPSTEYHMGCDKRAFAPITSKGSDQPSHPHSLIKTFAARTQKVSTKTTNKKSQAENKTSR